MIPTPEETLRLAEQYEVLTSEPVPYTFEIEAVNELTRKALEVHQSSGEMTGPKAVWTLITEALIATYWDKNGKGLDTTTTPTAEEDLIETTGPTRYRFPIGNPKLQMLLEELAEQHKTTKTTMVQFLIQAELAACILETQ